MKRILIALLVLAFAAPVFAGQNPHIQIYLYTTSTGVGGFNYKATPAEGSNTSVYVCFDHFGEGGGMYAANWLFNEVPGPDYMSTTNQFTAVGGLTIGIPGQAPGCSMTVGPVPVYPTANGVVVLARIRYETPGESRAGGYIQVLPYSAGDGPVVADANNLLDTWCVRSIATGTEPISGHFGWDAPPPIDGDCQPIVPVEDATWGSIKALYR